MRARFERGLEAGLGVGVGRVIRVVSLKPLTFLRQRRWNHLVASGETSIQVKRGIKYLLSTSDSYISKSIFINGASDYSKFQAVLRILGVKQVRHLIDVGANIGEISLMALHRSEALKVTAIEAEDRNFELLTINAHLNDQQNNNLFKLIHAAAGTGEPSHLHIKRSVNNWGDHQVHAPSSGDGPRGELVVPNVRIDDLCPSLTSLDYLLWVDVQGYEVQVLAGARELLKTRVPLVIELSPVHLQTHGTFDQLLRQIEHYSGYIDLGVHSPTLQSWDRLHARYEVLLKSKRHTDILFV